MSETEPEPRAAALIIAVQAGLRLIMPDGSHPWSRLSCPACGGALDLPLAGAGGSGRILAGDPAADVSPGGAGLDAARRVAAFVYRHRPGRLHQ